MQSPPLHLRIVSPAKVLLDSYVSSVSSKNSAGKFDILDNHANFITIIEDQPIDIKTDNQKPVTVQFKTAIISVSENNVNIYTY